MRRVVTLLNQVAATMESSAGLQTQMENAVKAAKQHQDDNLVLKQVSLTTPASNLGFTHSRLKNV